MLVVAAAIVTVMMVHQGCCSSPWCLSAYVAAAAIWCWLLRFCGSGFRYGRYPTFKGTELKGKTVFITGANTGIGFEAAFLLAQCGCRHIVISCRDREKADEALRKLQRRIVAAGLMVPQLTALTLELASTTSIDDCVRQYRALKLPWLDVLINNAGGMYIPQSSTGPLMRTQEGQEAHLGCNFVGPVRLTEALLPDLAAAPDGGRVVIVASRAHETVTSARQLATLMREHPDLPSVPRTYRGALLLYAVSKLGNIYHAADLARRCEAAKLRVTCLSLHPGIVASDFLRYFPIVSADNLFSRALKRVISCGQKTSFEAALTLIHGATAKDVVNGAYYADERRRAPTALGQDRSAADLMLRTLCSGAVSSATSSKWTH